MRGIRARFKLEVNGQAAGHRYWISLGDGSHTDSATLASARDAYAGWQWASLLGEPEQDHTWATASGEGMYVTVYRQYPNPKFGFEPQDYQRQNWIIAEPEVAHFRLYNPLFARACMNFSDGPTRWGDSIPFSEGDTKTFAYSVDEYFWDGEHEPIVEHDIKWSVHRSDDSDNYKEFTVTLSIG